MDSGGGSHLFLLLVSFPSWVLVSSAASRRPGLGSWLGSGVFSMIGRRRRRIKRRKAFGKGLPSFSFIVRHWDSFLWRPYGLCFRLESGFLGCEPTARLVFDAGRKKNSSGRRWIYDARTMREKEKKRQRRRMRKLFYIVMSIMVQLLGSELPFIFTRNFLGISPAGGAELHASVLIPGSLSCELRAGLFTRRRRIPHRARGFPGGVPEYTKTIKKRKTEKQNMVFYGNLLLYGDQSI